MGALGFARGTARVSGKVYLVGAGPGAPDLLTIRAARLLGQADIVLHDALVHPDTLALACGAILVDVGKRSGGRSTDQRFICRRLLAAARRHDCVVRLKGGDPMLFGRAQEEIDALREAGVDFEIVPGVTAALAASAATQVPLTHRGLSRSVSFVTPRVGRTEGTSDWARTVAASDTSALYMAARDAVTTRDGLLAQGMDPSTPVLLVEHASLPDERHLAGQLSHLPDLVAQLGDGPAVLLVGEAMRVAMRSAPSPRARVSGT